jgi:hypothetical protein
MISPNRVPLFHANKSVFSRGNRSDETTRKTPKTPPAHVMQRRLGQVIEIWVGRSPLTYKALGEKLGMPRQALPQVIRGQRKLDFIEALKLIEELELHPRDYVFLLRELRRMKDTVEEDTFYG